MLLSANPPTIRQSAHPPNSLLLFLCRRRSTCTPKDNRHQQAHREVPSSGSPTNTARISINDRLIFRQSREVPIWLRDSTLRRHNSSTRRPAPPSNTTPGCNGRRRQLRPVQHPRLRRLRLPRHSTTPLPSFSPPGHNHEAVPYASTVCTCVTCDFAYIQLLRNTFRHSVASCYARRCLERIW